MKAVINIALILTGLALAFTSHAQRIKDAVDIAGVPPFPFLANFAKIPGFYLTNINHQRFAALPLKSS